MAEERERGALQAEADAGGVGDAAVGELEPQIVPKWSWW